MKPGSRRASALVSIPQLPSGPAGSQARADGVPGRTVDMLSELDRAILVVANDSLHGQQGSATRLIKKASFRSRGILGAHPLGGGAEPDPRRAKQLVQAALREHLVAEVDHRCG